MVGYCGALHLTNLHLHNVLEETSANQVIELALIRLELSSILANLVVQEVNVISDVVAHRCRRSSL